MTIRTVDELKKVLEKYPNDCLIQLEVTEDSNGGFLTHIGNSSEGGEITVYEDVPDLVLGAKQSWVHGH